MSLTACHLEQPGLMTVSTICYIIGTLSILLIPNLLVSSVLNGISVFTRIFSGIAFKTLVWGGSESGADAK